MPRPNEIDQPITERVTLPADLMDWLRQRQPHVSKSKIIRLALEEYQTLIIILENAFPGRSMAAIIELLSKYYENPKLPK